MEWSPLESIWTVRGTEKYWPVDMSVASTWKGKGKVADIIDLMMDSDDE